MSWMQHATSRMCALQQIIEFGLVIGDSGSCQSAAEPLYNRDVEIGSDLCAPLEIEVWFSTTGERHCEF